MSARAGAPPSTADVELATVELLGALAYGQLRSFALTAQAVGLAPDVRSADVLAGFAVAEHAAFERLRDHLAGRTELAFAAMERQKATFDDFFDRAHVGGWFDASVFLAVGLPLAADFARTVAEVVDDAAAEVIVSTLAGRQDFERVALGTASTLLADDDARERARHLVADLLGRALTGFQAASGSTDALQVLFRAHDPDGDEESRVRRLAMTVLGGHRRRVVELGLEDLEDD